MYHISPKYLYTVFTPCSKMSHKQGAYIKIYIDTLAFVFVRIIKLWICITVAYKIQQSAEQTRSSGES